MSTHPLREYREAHGLTVDSAAQALGCSKASVSRIETGDQLPSVALARSIHAHFGIDLCRLRPDIWDAPAPEMARAG